MSDNNDNQNSDTSDPRLSDGMTRPAYRVTFVDDEGPVSTIRTTDINVYNSLHNLIDDVHGRCVCNIQMLHATR